MTGAPGTTPVIVGAGHVTNRPRDLNGTAEPAQLLADAVGYAGRDAGLTAAELAGADSLDVVNIVSWPYGDPCGEVARRAGLAPRRRFYSPVGGDQPTVLLDAAARRVAGGDSDFSVIVGGEAVRSISLYGRAGQEPPWTPRGDPPNPLDRAAGTTGIAHYGLTAPATVYPIFENAYRAAQGRGFAAEQRRSAEIWSSFSEVAARTPGAWLTEPRSPEEIVTPGPGNRMIAFPYPKLMCALPGVDQSAALIATSAARARHLGVPEDQWVYPWGGAGADDTAEVIERPTYSDAPALHRVLHDTLASVGLSPADVDLYELYSCFPVVPKLAADALGLSGSGGDAERWTVAGSLTFYGGPLSAYMCCAAAHMVRALRRGDGDLGLLYGNGEYLTKHHGLLLSSEPRAGGAYPGDDRSARQADIDALDSPEVVEAAEGAARIETYTVIYDGDGEPQRSVVIGRLGDGRRFAAGTRDDAATIAALTNPRVEAVGRTGHVVHTEHGNRFDLD